MQNSRRDFLRLLSSVSAMAAGAATASRAFAVEVGRGLSATHSSLSTNELPTTRDAEKSPSHDLMRRIKAISNVFEVGRAEPDYAYVENLGDGRGFTVTQYGFCTYNNE